MLTRRTRILADRRKGRIVRAPGWQKPVRGTQLNRTHPLARGLVAGWIFNEGSGLYVNDITGGGANGTLNASLAWEPTEKGLAIDFGLIVQNYLITITDTKVINLPTTKNFSAIVFHKPNWTGAGGDYGSALSWGGTDDIMVYVNDHQQGTGGLRFFWRDCGSNIISYNGTDLNGIWTMTAVTVKAGAQAGYQDGVLIGSGTDDLDGAGPFSTFRIGGWADSHQAFGGHQAFVYLYDRALIADEIAQLHREPYCMFQRERRVSILTPLYRFWPDDAISLWYSKGNYDTLPTGEEDYEDDFQGKDYENVEFADGVYVLQTADGEKAGFRFNRQNTNNTDPISISIENIKSTLAPSSSVVYLQIYNRNTPAWETLDSESVVGADTLFDLSGVQSSDLSYYYDSDNVVRFRVYQAPS